MMELFYTYGFPVALCLLTGLSLHFVDMREKSYAPKGEQTLYPARLGAESALLFPVLMAVFLIFYHLDPNVFLIYFITSALLFTTYLAVFVLATPVFRRVFQANSCAALWSVPSIQLLFIGSACFNSAYQHSVILRFRVINSY